MGLPLMSFDIRMTLVRSARSLTSPPGNCDGLKRGHRLGDVVRARRAHLAHNIHLSGLSLCQRNRRNHVLQNTCFVEAVYSVFHFLDRMAHAENPVLQQRQVHSAVRA